jgi:FkbM family methyltransferase
MWRKVLGYTLAAGAGLALKIYVFPHLFISGWAVTAKLVDRAEQCSWQRTLAYFSRLENLEHLCDRAAREVRITGQDEEWELARVSTRGERDLWMPITRSGRPGEQYAWRVAEQQWMEQSNPEDHVQPGDIVVDAGAGAGLFVAKALKRGASKVLAIEPDPRNVECLRRNFQPEIAFGRVVVAPAGVSSGEPDEGWLTNVSNVGQEAASAPLTTIDQLVRDLKLARVHFIRVDPSLNSKDALQGASRVLRQDRPRVMLNLRPVSGEGQLPPRILRLAHSDYRASCGPCKPDGKDTSRVVPHVVYYR